MFDDDTRSIRARQVQYVFRDEIQDHVGRDRRHQVEPRVSELVLEGILLGEAEAAMRLHALGAAAGVQGAATGTRRLKGRWPAA